jgi:membrane associated rhomboid family serine protease
MGIQDRDYYRGSGPSFLGSLAERGTVCKWLISINVVVFLVQMATMPAGGRTFGPVTEALDLNVSRVLHGEVWRLLTCTFLHHPLNFWHIFWNMLFLWWFGHKVEDIYGHREFLTFYLVSAVVSSLAFVAASLMNLYDSPALGASGAVTAVLLVYACHYPSDVILFMLVLPIPIWFFVAFAILKDMISLFGPSQGIASACHLGGAAFGYLYYQQQWRLSTWLPDLRGWLKRRSQPRLRIYREEEPLAPVGVPSSPSDEQLEARMDAILEKISRSGKDSLTESEREVLLRASEALRRRRT